MFKAFYIMHRFENSLLQLNIRDITSLLQLNIRFAVVAACGQRWGPFKNEANWSSRCYVLELRSALKEAEIPCSYLSLECRPRPLGALSEELIPVS